MKTEADVDKPFQSPEKRNRQHEEEGLTTSRSALLVYRVIVIRQIDPTQDTLHSKCDLDLLI